MKVVTWFFKFIIDIFLVLHVFSLITEGTEEGASVVLLLMILRTVVVDIIQAVIAILRVLNEDLNIELNKISEKD